MKKRLSAVLVLLVVGLFALGQLSCTPPQDSQTTNVPTPEATPDTAAIEKELLRIENDWPRVMKEKDGQAVRRIDADDVHLLGWDGSIATKEEDAKFIESGNLTADSVVMSDLKVKVLGKDTAVVTGSISISGGKSKTQGTTVDVSGQYRFVDTFVRRDGEWKVVASSSVKVMAPASSTPSPAAKASPSPTAAPAAMPSPATRPSPAVRPSPIKVAPAASPVKTTTPNQ